MVIINRCPFFILYYFLIIDYYKKCDYICVYIKEIINFKKSV